MINFEANSYEYVSLRVSSGRLALQDVMRRAEVVSASHMCEHWLLCVRKSFAPSTSH